MGSGEAAAPNPDISRPGPIQGVHTRSSPPAVMWPAAAGNDVSAAAIEGTAATTPRTRASMWTGHRRFTVPPPLPNTRAERKERPLPSRRADLRRPPRASPLTPSPPAPGGFVEGVLAYSDNPVSRRSVRLVPLERSEQR